MLTIPLTRDFYSLLDDDDRDLAAYTWSADSKGYTYRRDRLFGERLMHRIILSRILDRPLQKHEQVDHINGRPYDNRRSNIRLATRTENARNKDARGVQPVQKTPLSPVRWRARIRVNGIGVHIGYFATEQEARQAYQDAKRQHFGAFGVRPAEQHEETAHIIPRIHRWSRQYDCCRLCGTTTRKHQGHGYCTRCRYYR